MMNHLRESAHGIFAKILLGLLVFSFGIWGIGDIFRQDGKASNVATVGGTNISQQEYQHALHQQQESLRQKFGNKYNPDIIRKLGIDKMVRDQLIVNLLVEEETRALGIVVGDDNVIDIIQADPHFHNEDGHFESSLYLDTLRNAGMGESRYVDTLRKDTAAKLLNNVLVSGIVAPEELVQALYKIREEQRIADILVIPLSAASQIPAPGEKELKAYYDSHAKEFSAPEYRTLSYIVLKEADIQSKINVSEEDIKRVYQERTQDFRKPERRTVEQLLFDNEADAKNAADKLAHGARFADIEKENSVTNKDKTSLGTITRQEAPAQMADAIFALKENAVSPPLHSEFGWHIFHVSKIEPESTPTLAQVRTTIANDLAGRQAQETMASLINTLEDTLAGGAPLKAAAEKIGQKIITVGPITRDGTMPDNKKAALPPYDNFVNTAFAINEKDHSQAIQTNDGSYFLVQVDSVQPEHVYPLADIQNQIVAAWREEKKHALLQSLSQEIAAELHSGKKISQVLAHHNVSLSPFNSGRLKRSQATLTSGPLAKQVLPDGLVRELFQLKPGGSTHSYALANGNNIIASLSQVIPAPAVAGNAAALEPVRDELKETMAKEALQNYLAYLETKFRVTKNDAALGIKDQGNSE